MKPKQIQITVSNPCHEKWSDMTSTDHGAFCQSCSREVIDFSRMTDREVIEYLSTHQAGCGRFRRDQVEAPLTMAVVDNGTLRWRALLLGLLPMLAGEQLSAGRMNATVLTDQSPTPLPAKKDTAKILAGIPDTIASPACIPDTIVVTGKVTDYNRVPIAGAEVSVHYPSGSHAGISTVTDSSGYFEMQLTASMYTYGMPYLRVVNDKYERKVKLTQEERQMCFVFMGDERLYIMGGMGWSVKYVSAAGKQTLWSRMIQLTDALHATARGEFTVYGKTWYGGLPLRDVSIRVVDSAGRFYGNGAVSDADGAYSIQISRAEQELRDYHLEYSLDGHYQRDIPLTKAATQRKDISLPAQSLDRGSVEFEDMSRMRLFLLRAKWRLHKLAARWHLIKKNH